MTDREKIEHLYRHLSAAGIALTTAGIVLRHLGHPDEAVPYEKAADQILTALDRANG